MRAKVLPVNFVRRRRFRIHTYHLPVAVETCVKCVYIRVDVRAAGRYASGFETRAPGADAAAALYFCRTDPVKSRQQGSFL